MIYIDCNRIKCFLIKSHFKIRIEAHLHLYTQNGLSLNINREGPKTIDELS